MYLPSLKHSLPLLAALVLAACSSTHAPGGKTPADNMETAESSAVPSRPAEPEGKTLADYGGYPSALDAVKQKNDAAVAAYLENAGDSAMAENVRNEWLKSLGARRQWTLFAPSSAIRRTLFLPASGTLLRVSILRPNSSPASTA